MHLILPLILQGKHLFCWSLQIFHCNSLKSYFTDWGDTKHWGHVASINLANKSYFTDWGDTKHWGHVASINLANKSYFTDWGDTKHWGHVASINLANKSYFTDWGDTKHWGHVASINLADIGSGVGVSPAQHQYMITWKNEHIWSIKHFGRMLIKIWFHSWKCIWHCHVPNFGQTSMCSAMNGIIVNKHIPSQLLMIIADILVVNYFQWQKKHVWLHVDVVHARWLSVIMLIDDLHVVLSYRMPHFHIAILYDGKRETWCGLSVFLYFISNAVNSVCAELCGGNIMIYLHFLSFLDDEMLTEGRGLFIRPNQYYGCKWMTTQGTMAWATMELT